MKIQNHAVVGCIAGLLMLRFWSVVKSLFFAFGSILPDPDHIIDFVIRAKPKTLKISYLFKKTNAFVMVQQKVLPNRKDALSFFYFHSIEFLVLLFSFYLFTKLVIKSGFLSDVLIGTFYGTTIHIALDVIDTSKKKIQKTYSLIHYLIRIRQMKKHGIDPDGAFKEILKEMQIPTK